MREPTYPDWILEELEPGESVIFYSTREVSAMYRVALSTAQGWVRDRVLRAIHTPGGAARIPHTELRRRERAQNVSES